VIKFRVRGEIDMKTRLVFFLIGTVLFLTSLPLGTKIVMELIHSQKMNEEYSITNVSEGFPPTDSTFQFKDNIVEIEETIKDENSHIDPWNKRIGIADLSLKIDGKEIDTLKGYPVRMEAEGLNRYYGDVAYLIVEDKINDKTQFIVLLKKTKEIQKKMPNGDIDGWVSPEKLRYTLYAIDEDGNYKNKNFSYSERDALQTELLNAGVVFPYRIGYYTDALQAYPSILFPLIFPFVTLLLGFIMMLLFFPIRKIKK
jgi:hypothetical protein